MKFHWFLLLIFTGGGWRDFSQGCLFHIFTNKTRGFLDGSVDGFCDFCSELELKLEFREGKHNPEKHDSKQKLAFLVQ